MLSYVNHSNLMLSFVIWSKKNLDSMDNKQQKKGDKINEVQIVTDPHRRAQF